MAAPVAHRESRRFPSYSGWLAARLRLPALMLAFAVSGCAMSGDIGGLLGKKSDPQTDDLVTGSIKPQATVAVPTSGLPPEVDLAYARAAASELLGRNGLTASAPWENPRTGARGTVTPIASAYQNNGTPCRDFLASYLHDKTETWLQGEACLAPKGKWEVKNFKPWTRS